MSDHDEALTVLLEVYRSKNPGFPEKILRESYAIEKLHQFERDREISSNEIRRAVTIAVEKELGDGQ